MKINMSLTLMLLTCLLLNLNNCNLKSDEDLNKNNQDNVDKEVQEKGNEIDGFQSDEGNRKNRNELEEEQKEREKYEQELYKWFKDTMAWYSWHTSAFYNHFVGFINNVSMYGNYIINNESNGLNINTKTKKTYLEEIKRAYELGGESPQKDQTPWGGGLKKNKERIKNWLEGMREECERFEIKTTLKEEIRDLEDKMLKFEKALGEYEKDNQIIDIINIAKEIIKVYNKLEKLIVNSYLEIFKKVVLTDFIFKTEKFQKQLKEEFGRKIDETNSCLTGNKKAPRDCHGIGGGDEYYKDLLP